MVEVKETMAALSLIALSLVLLVSPTIADNESELIFRLYDKYKDWRPAAVVDVGANVGGWTSRVLIKLYDNRNEEYPLVMMFEATEMHRPKLQAVKDTFNAKSSGKVDFRIDVLTDVDDRIVHFFQGKNTGNSLFRENSIHYKDDVPVERKSVTLDTAIQQSFLASSHQRVDFLKLDVQGGELVVLQGATQLLKTVTFIQFEVSAVEYNYGGAACWSDLDQFLQRRGFRLYDLGDRIYNSDAFHTQGVGQLDVLYYRPDSPYRPKGLDEAKFCKPLFLADTTVTTASFSSSTKSVQEIPFGVESLLMENHFVSLTQIGALVLVFAAGYVMGSWKSRRSGKSKSRSPAYHVDSVGRSVN